jgi:hypothetical protein
MDSRAILSAVGESSLFIRSSQTGGLRMSVESNIERFVAELTEYLPLERYISPQTKTKIFEVMDTYGEWPELMNERSIIDDLLWQGMPASRPILRIYLSGRNIYQQAAKKAGKRADKTKAEKMSDYVLVAFGLLAEPDEVMDPYTGSTVTLDLRNGEIKVRLHVWRQSLFCRNVRPRYECFFLSPDSPAAQHYKTSGWWGRVEDLNHERRDLLDKLADGFILIARNPEMIIKSQRKPRISQETFLSEGLAGAEALAREGKAHLYIKQLADKMERDREAVKNCSVNYKQEWVAINKKFADTKEWLRIHKRT